MATDAVSQGSVRSSLIPSRGIKNVLSNRSRTSTPDGGSDTSSAQGLRMSADSTREDSSKDLSRISSRDDSSKSGSSGIRKLIPGHAKRKRRLRESEGSPRNESQSAVISSAVNNNNNANTKSPALVSNQSSTSVLTHDDETSSLLTDDSEPASARLPLLTHESHSGYLTYSSPLINTTSIDDSSSNTQAQEKKSLSSEELVHGPTADSSKITSVKRSPTLPLPSSTTTPFSSTLFDRANTIGPPTESQSGPRKSISKSFRSISPSRKLREAFQPGKSPNGPNTSPDRGSLRNKGTAAQPAETDTTVSRADAQSDSQDSPLVLADSKTNQPNRSKNPRPGLPPLNIEGRPQTPPGGGSPTPVTTVTPPTPVGSRASAPGSPVRASNSSGPPNEGGGIFVSTSSNMISHRHVRSESGSLHRPSKLSNAISAPLTPTIEEARSASSRSDPRSASPASGFFATWVSAAQNAANTITNTLNTQTKGRSGTEEAEQEKPISTDNEFDSTAVGAPGPGLSKKQLAVETLGAGDLKLSHLGIDTESKENGSTGSGLVEGRRASAIRRDEADAKIEDLLAKRAVSAAYETPSDDKLKTPVAEPADPMNNMRHSSTFTSMVSNETTTTPNGSVVEGDSGSVKRNNSVRSRLKERRKRGSSTATGASTVGTLLAASVTSLAGPAVTPKLTAFAVAPKSRNRTFHQLFRSVPDDDFLIDDYSCALQKEILLAGRIYISEGHICFSSNILGWVTTLVISFEEVMAVERETTAMVFPNAIAVQTLHARHTFRSLLSREATFDLMVGIWKSSHPAAFKKSITGEQAEEDIAKETDKPAGSDSDSDEGSVIDDEIYNEDEDDEEPAGSFVEAGSLAGSDMTDGARSMSRKGLAGNGGGAAGQAVPYPPAAGDGQAAEKAVAAASAATTDFPGPATHSPTDCTDSANHYDKILKDEIIAAPLGKIYSMLFGPTSGVFLTKYLVDEQKVTELQYEDDKRGLGEQNKCRTYSYIKPLYGAIGPKQTKCTTTENLDAFDLERAVSVTCTTQTPDVPSGNVFSVRTRYCLSWAAGNSTRFQMNCTVEWTGKSWLKGPIEKGATDGQQTYGTDLVRALKSAVSSRPRAATAGSKGAKPSKRRRKGEKSPSSSPKSQVSKHDEEHWGLLEPFRGTLGPIVGVLKPFTGALTVATIVVLLWIIWSRRPDRGPATAFGYPGYPSSTRLAAYEEIWQNEESELWLWLEDRAGTARVLTRDSPDQNSKKASRLKAESKAKERQRILASKNVEARLRDERMSEREMEDAIRVTGERLKVLEELMERRKSGRKGNDAAVQDSK